MAFSQTFEAQVGTDFPPGICGGIALFPGHQAEVRKAGSDKTLFDVDEDPANGTDLQMLAGGGYAMAICGPAYGIALNLQGGFNSPDGNDGAFQFAITDECAVGGVLMGATLRVILGLQGTVFYDQVDQDLDQTVDLLSLLEFLISGYISGSGTFVQVPDLEPDLPTSWALQSPSYKRLEGGVSDLMDPKCVVDVNLLPLIEKASGPVGQAVSYFMSALSALGLHVAFGPFLSCTFQIQVDVNGFSVLGLPPAPVEFDNLELVYRGTLTAGNETSPDLIQVELTTQGTQVSFGLGFYASFTLGQLISVEAAFDFPLGHDLDVPTDDTTHDDLISGNLYASQSPLCDVPAVRFAREAA